MISKEKSMYNNKQNTTPVDILVEKGYDNIIVFRNPDYETCLIGITPDGNAVYDYDQMIDWLIETKTWTKKKLLISFRTMIVFIMV